MPYRAHGFKNAEIYSSLTVVRQEYLPLKVCEVLDDSTQCRVYIWGRSGKLLYVEYLGSVKAGGIGTRRQSVLRSAEMV